MKRFISIFLTMLLVVALAVSVSAKEYNGVILPDVYSSQFNEDYYFIIVPNGATNGNSNYKAYIFSSAVLVNSNTFPTSTTLPAYTKFWEMDWQYGDSAWSTPKSYNFTFDYGIAFSEVVWTNFDIFDKSGNLVVDGEEPSPPICDGSACPATDANHDNVCDDCGNVLAYSLRSDLLTYAYTHLASGQGLYTSDDYWLITESEEGGYYIYLSNEPFSYGMSTAVLSSDGTMHTSSVITMSTGQNGGRGWQTKSPGTALPYGNPVASSHDIEGFFPGALWEEMEAVTQGAIVAEQIRLNRTVGILVTTGVGLVALLVLFRLLAKKSLIYRS